MDKDKDMSRRRFLKMAALTGAAMWCRAYLEQGNGSRTGMDGETTSCKQHPCRHGGGAHSANIETRKYGIHCFCNGIWLYGLEP